MEKSCLTPKSLIAIGPSSTRRFEERSRLNCFSVDLLTRISRSPIGSAQPNSLI